MSAVELATAAAAAPVVVGGLHRDGSDRSLLLDAADLPAVTAALAAAGWVARPGGRRFARFGSEPAQAVQVAALDGLVGPGDAERLRGAPLALADRLLLAALLVPPGAPAPRPEHRRDVHALLAADAGGWLRASVAADRLGRGDHLVAVQDAYEQGRPVPGAPARGLLVALSGLDGAGKSTQAHRLAAALQQVGCDTAVLWARVGQDAALDRIGRPVKRLLGRGGAGGGDQPAAPGSPGRVEPRRSRGRAVDPVWAAVVAAVHGGGQRRDVAAAAAPGRVVIRDRYRLDARVHLVDRYGGGAPALALLDRLVPRPDVAFLLALDPQEAARRKPGDADLPDLVRHAARYRAEAAAEGVPLLDAARPAAELAAQIAAQVWSRLPG